MPKIKYRVVLTEDERAKLQQIGFNSERLSAENQKRLDLACR